MSNGPMKQLVTHLHLSHIESALDVSGCFSLNTSWPKHQGQVFQRQMCLSDVSSGMNIKTPAKKCQPPAKNVKLPQIPKSHTIKISRTHLITSLTANRMTNARSLSEVCPCSGASKSYFEPPLQSKISQLSKDMFRNLDVCPGSSSCEGSDEPGSDQSLAPCPAASQN